MTGDGSGAAFLRESRISPLLSLRDQIIAAKNLYIIILAGVGALGLSLISVLMG